MNVLRARLVSKPAFVRMHVARLVLQLLFDPVSLKGFVSQLRTADRRTDQSEVDSRLGELRPDLLVLDLVQAERHRSDAPPLCVPALCGGDVLNGLDGVVIED